MEFVFEREVKPGRFLGLAMMQEGPGFARIMVAVVVEENDLAAEFRLEPPRRADFRHQEAAWEKAAGLLAEADDRGGAHGRIKAKG